MKYFVIYDEYCSASFGSPDDDSHWNIELVKKFNTLNAAKKCYDDMIMSNRYMNIYVTQEVIYMMPPI